MYSKGDPYQDEDSFDWTNPGATRCDERLDQLFTMFDESQLTVRTWNVDDVGGITLFTGDHLRFEVFPDNSLEDEYWRLFRPYNDAEHFVITGQGLES